MQEHQPVGAATGFDPARGGHALRKTAVGTTLEDQGLARLAGLETDHLANEDDVVAAGVAHLVGAFEPRAASFEQRRPAESVAQW